MSKLTISLNLFQVPLTLSNRICAESFASQQFDPEKKQQVYKNTLAVLAVNTYLQCLGWVTSLDTSDSWDSITQTLLDIADLVIPGYGQIECRVVLSQQQVMVIPEEVSSNRIAYIAVSIDNSQKFARLLGFVSELSSSTIPLTHLKSISEFPEYLEQISQKLILPKLSNWLEGIVEAGWNTLDNLLTTQPDLVFRLSSAQLHFRTGMMSVSTVSPETSQETLTTGVSRVKIWNLGKKDNYSKIALVISLLSSENELEISLKVCPTDDHAYLPEGLAIKILDETQQPILQAQTKTNNENIEFFISGERGEYFSIQASLDGKTQIERFII